MSAKIVFLGIWTPLMVWVCYGLFFEKNTRQAEGEPIAQITAQSGLVQFRPQQDIIWQNTEKNQFLFENDNISTGENSYASINLANKKIIELGPDTQIHIRPLTAEKDSFQLDLVRGVVGTKEAKPSLSKLLTASKNDIDILAGNAKFVLKAKDSQLVLNKARGEASNAKVLMASGKITQDQDGKEIDLPKLALASSPIDSDAGTLSLAQPTAPPPPPPPPPTPQPTAKPRPRPPTPPQARLALLSKETYLPEVISPAPNSVIWSLNPLEKAGDIPLSVIIAPPKTLGSEYEWLPFVRVGSSLPSRTTVMLEGKALNQPQAFKIYPSRLKEKRALVKQTLDQYVLTATPGANLRDKTNADTLQAVGSPLDYRIKVVPILEKRGIKIDMERMGYDSKTSNWLVLPENFTAKNWIYLNDGSDVASLGGVLAASGGFSISQSPNLLEGEGIFIVRNHRIIGRISDNNIGVETLHALRNALNAQVVYRGRSDAYIGGSQEIGKLIKQGRLPEKFFILNEGRFIGISREFMKTNPSARRFLKENTSAFFGEPIQTLSPVQR